MENAMVSLVAAAVTFVGSHFALSHPLRGALNRRFGARGFQALYSLVALASFGWMIAAFRQVPAVAAPLWNGSGSVAWAAASALTLIASVLLVGSLRGNPALPDPRASTLAAGPVHGVFHATRHPMMWSFALWAAAHAVVAATPRVLVLSGAIGFLALVGAHLQDRKKQALMGRDWADWAARTSYWPQLGSLARAGALNWSAGLALWLAATWAHIPTVYVPAGLWRWLVG